MSSMECTKCKHWNTDVCDNCSGNYEDLFEEETKLRASKYFPVDCITCSSKDVCQAYMFSEMVKTTNGVMECEHWQEVKENKE